ncbi:hypothetical protein F5X96DRAFT_661505 [Biscogniauxia mediterranea]|nr:hypothetical protein F5X96DRAFT_661505 [Biscogniauxia mediterranea]
MQLMCTSCTAYSVTSSLPGFLQAKPRPVVACGTLRSFNFLTCAFPWANLNLPRHTLTQRDFHKSTISAISNKAIRCPVVRADQVARFRGTSSVDLSRARTTAPFTGCEGYSEDQETLRVSATCVTHSTAKLFVSTCRCRRRSLPDPPKTT